MGGGLQHRFIGTVSPGAPLLPHECARVCVSAAVPGSPTYPECHARKYTPNPETTELARRVSFASDWSERPHLAPPPARARSDWLPLGATPAGSMESRFKVRCTERYPARRWGGGGKRAETGGEQPNASFAFVLLALFFPSPLSIPPPFLP